MCHHKTFNCLKYYPAYWVKSGDNTRGHIISHNWKVSPWAYAFTYLNMEYNCDSTQSFIDIFNILSDLNSKIFDLLYCFRIWSRKL